MDLIIMVIHIYICWYTIYHHLPYLPVVKGVNLQSPLFSSTNQWEFGTSMYIYIYRCVDVWNCTQRIHITALVIFGAHPGGIFCRKKRGWDRSTMLSMGKSTNCLCAIFKFANCNNLPEGNSLFKVVIPSYSMLLHLFPILNP